jgi:hypothetical protein
MRVSLVSDVLNRRIARMRRMRSTVRKSATGNKGHRNPDRRRKHPARDDRPRARDGGAGDEGGLNCRWD